MTLLIPVPFTLIATYTDVRYRKIRNYTTYPLILIGFITNIYVNGVLGIERSFISILMTFFLLAIIPGLGFSGGDKKLLMGIFIFLTKNQIYEYLIIYILLSASILLFNCLYKLGVMGTFECIKSAIVTKVDHMKITIPVAPIILISYLIVLIRNFTG
ncbi:MAG: A24 family peptidase [Clostridia bacterium]|nr:A24 family peptidase [Clostridia bacterium]